VEVKISTRNVLQFSAGYIVTFGVFGCDQYSWRFYCNCYFFIVHMWAKVIGVSTGIRAGSKPNTTRVLFPCHRVDRWCACCGSVGWNEHSRERELRFIENNLSIKWPTGTMGSACRTERRVYKVTYRANQTWVIRHNR